MAHNPILEELYAIREKLLADAGGDIHKYLAGVREREAASGRLLKPTPPRTYDAAAANTAVFGLERQTLPSVEL